MIVAARRSSSSDNSYSNVNTKELLHGHCGTNNRAPQWTFTDPCKPEARPCAREESASPAWLAAPAMNARDTTKVYIWRLDTGCGPTLYRKCHSHNTPGKRHNNTWVEPFAGNCTTSSTRQTEHVWQKCQGPVVFSDWLLIPYLHWLFMSLIFVILVLSPIRFPSEYMMTVLASMSWWHWDNRTMSSVKSRSSKDSVNIHCIP